MVFFFYYELNFFIITKNRIILVIRNLKFIVKVLGKATKEGYWPKQIITAVPEDDKITITTSNDYKYSSDQPGWDI